MAEAASQPEAINQKEGNENIDEGQAATGPAAASAVVAAADAAVAAASAESGGGSGPVSPQVHDLCREMFEKTTEYLQGELLSTSEEYLLLEKLNKLTTAKYSDMSSLSKDLTVMMKELNGKYRNLQPYLEQIDQLDATVSTLEQAAYQLESYSKKLEAKLRQLDKR